MPQSLTWFLYELRDTFNTFWYNGGYLLVMAGCALAVAGWFSLRRS